jgi:hypothetical protein
MHPFQIHSSLRSYEDDSHVVDYISQQQSIQGKPPKTMNQTLLFTAIREKKMDI